MDPLTLVEAMVIGPILFGLLFLLAALVERTGPTAAGASGSARAS